MDSAQSGSQRDRSGFGRKRFLINPKFQLTLIGFNFILALIAITVFYGENIFLFSKFTQMESPELASDPIIQQLIQEEQSRMQMVFMGTSLVVLLAMIIGGLILSNRVAGPIYRLQKYLQDREEGKVTGELKFRKKDFFPELAEAINRALKK